MDGYYAWMLVATAFVLMMTVPALALFYGGMSRSKSVLNMMMMSFVSVGIVGIVYVLWGWSMAWGPDEVLGGAFTNPFDLFALKDVPHESYIGMAFQMTFAIITAALISGAIADRVKFSAWVVFLPLWVTLSYFPLSHMVFSCTEDSWICGRQGAQDYAGGTAVHINAGIAALVLAVIIGKRVGFGKQPMKPHNLTLTMIGAGLLWLGWYGFNVGSIVFTGATDEENTAQFMSETGLTFVNTTLATCAAMLAWLIIERILHGKATSLGAASGIVAGLVAITPACGAVDVGGAIAIGAVAGAVCAWAVGLKYKLGLDDSLDVVGVHLVGGIVGTLLIGLFSTQSVDGLFYGGGWDSLWSQTKGVLIAVAWSGIATAILGYAIKYTIGWRITEEEEVDGIDFAEHGESAYDLATSGGGSVLTKEGAL
ncbi:Amt family ammonium transporter [Marmoricola sp. OAE513]|uniref:ammonium transporter n=1 Tax=Marmoricola sp. OAE513 TaxID=2817894 RepID=UPI001AE81CE6